MAPVGWMLRLRPYLLIAGLLAPTLVHAAPPGKSARAETKARDRALPRGGKTIALSRASQRGTTSPRPDVCALQQKEARSVTLRTHRIERGDSLSGIAWTYGTSVRALAAANALSEEQTIRTGQLLVIPQHSRPGGGDDWLRYASVPKQRGYLDIITHKSRYRGAVVEGGRIVPAARQAVSELLGATGSRPPLSDRLIRLLVRVSDTFGGRTLYIVSGYRSSSYFTDSRHKSSEAVDFSIVGVPNVVLRQYLLLLDDVGVGYYPNSSFLHLDVRGCAMQWVDYAGPGEAPRRSPRQPAGRVFAAKGGGAPRRAGNARMAELDTIAEKVAAAMEEASKPARVEGRVEPRKPAESKAADSEPVASSPPLQSD
jgi:LysM repeat protein